LINPHRGSLNLFPHPVAEVREIWPDEVGAKVVV